MKGVTALLLAAAGAILAFAVHAHVPGFQLTAIGWILLLAGVAGLVIPAQRSGWLRRRMVVGGTKADTLPHRTAAKRPRRDPAAVAAKILQDAQVAPADTQITQREAPPRREPHNRQAPA